MDALFSTEIAESCGSLNEQRRHSFNGLGKCYWNCWNDWRFNLRLSWIRSYSMWAGWWVYGFIAVGSSIISYHNHLQVSLLAEWFSLCSCDGRKFSLWFLTIAKTTMRTAALFWIKRTLCHFKFGMTGCLGESCINVIMKIDSSVYGPTPEFWAQV